MMRKITLEVSVDVPDDMSDADAKETIEAVLEQEARHGLECVNMKVIQCKVRE